MIKLLPLIWLTALGASPAFAQNEEADEQARIPVNVRLTIGHYDGDQLVDRGVHSLHVTTNRLPHTELRQGREVPILSSKDGATSAQYRNVGTNIQCRVRTRGDRFLVELALEQSDFAEERPSDTPSFHTFNIEQALMLTDGGRTELATTSIPGTNERWVVSLELDVVD